MDSDRQVHLDALSKGLAAPHHLNQTDWSPFREGVVLKSSPAEATGEGEDRQGGGHAFIDVGLDRMAYCPTHLPVHARVSGSGGWVVGGSGGWEIGGSGGRAVGDSGGWEVGGSGGWLNVFLEMRGMPPVLQELQIEA